MSWGHRLRPLADGEPVCDEAGCDRRAVWLASCWLPAGAGRLWEDHWLCELHGEQWAAEHHAIRDEGEQR
jgi:hypothetical protein